MYNWIQENCNIYAAIGILHFARVHCKSHANHLTQLSKVLFSENRRILGCDTVPLE